MMQSDIGAEFIEKTKYQHLGPSEQQLGVPQPLTVLPFSKGGAPLALPSPNELETDLKKLIDARISVRRFSDMPLTQSELSYLLWCTQGVKLITNNRLTRRTVPSAGSRHAFETFLLINRVEGLLAGIYRYLALEHQITPFILQEGIAEKMTEACLQQEMVAECAITFIWVAVPQRMTWRYQQRGYRYLFLDAGHVCQNLYLAAESLGCGVCAIGAYDDDKVNQLLQLDGVNEFAIYLAVVGRRAS